MVSSSKLWLGLDAVLLTAFCCFAFAAGAALLLRSESKSGKKRSGLRRALYSLGIATWLIPLSALVTGLAPEGARDRLPDQEFASVAGWGLDGSLSTVSAGGYELLAHAGTKITASVKAGGETFEARFAGDAKGVLRFDPTDLSQPLAAEFSFASSSIDTGIELRSKHASEALRTEEYPLLVFALERVVGTANTGPNELSFRAEGALTLVGKTSTVSVTGTISAPDDEGRRRLGFPDAELLIVRASFAISVKESGLEDDDTFDQDAIAIQVSLVLRRTRSGR